ncbi:MAG: putative baseplate assembly protein, partial [Planctomycetota bacterium]
SDPGITLIELFAWMTELILYRLNKVPDKVYITLLDLIGIRLRPPQPANVQLTFNLVEGADTGVWVPKGTQVATEPTEDGDQIIFESDRELYVTNVKAVKCYSIDRDRVADNTSFIAIGNSDGFDVFQGTKQIERMFYLGDDRFSALQEISTVQIVFDFPTAKEEDPLDLVEWEYWNGRRWREMSPVTLPADELPAGQSKVGIAFAGPLEDIESGDVCELGEGRDGDTYWIRARLIEVPIRDEATIVDTIEVTTMILQDGVGADEAIANTGAGIFLPLDVSRSFFPFGEDPDFDYCFYLSSEECFQREDSQFRIELQLTDPSSISAPNPSPDLRIKWEYWNGRRWSEICSTTPVGPAQPIGYSFEDTTHAFTQSGYINFLRPQDMEKNEVNGTENYWIRARVEQGHYGKPGKFEIEDGNWVWKEPQPLRPPSFNSLMVKYSQVPYSVSKFVTYNDFNFREESHNIRTEHRLVQPFEPYKEENPAVYLGFDKPLPNKPATLYFRMDEEDEAPDADLHLEEPLADEGMSARKKKKDRPSQRVVWEYWNGKVWSPLYPKDYTYNFTQSGSLEILGPNDMTEKREFGFPLFWIRGRLEMGSYTKAPWCLDVRLNTIEALNAETIRNEVLGYSDGTPDQDFSFGRSPVLRGQKIIIRESEVPARRDARQIMQDEGDDAIREVRDDNGNIVEVWVRWHEVESFYRSTPSSRHYTIDPITGEVRFGDGIRGMIPPMGVDNVVAEEYRNGGGTIGNVGAASLVVLRQSIAYIESTYNPYSASGGSDRETIDEAKMRGPQVIKNRYRAVTSEDFEWLALRASGSVARARCVASPKRAGEVSVLIVPIAGEGEADLTIKPIPTPELIRKVKDFLDERRLITTKLRVGKPRFVEVSIDVDVVMKPLGPKGDSLKREIENAVRKFTNPLQGGPEGEGWPFGRMMHKSDLLKVI